MTSTHQPPNEAAVTLERSIRMAPVQRVGLVVVFLSMLAAVGSIGWSALLPALGSLVAFLVIKAPPVQTRLGVWSSGVVWALGQVGIIGAVLLSAGQPEYMVAMIAMPTLLGSVVWPERWVRRAALITAVTILGVGALAEGRNFADNLAPYVIIAAIAIALSLLTLVARQAEAASHDQTRTDALTGVGNRKALADTRHRIENAKERRALGVIVLDVDRFKAVNDDFGHPVGDAALTAVAQTLVDTVDGRGSVFRFGGEEFVVVLEGAGAAHAAAMAEHLRRAVAHLCVSSDGVACLVDSAPAGKGSRLLTLSVGVAATDTPVAGAFEALFERADARLFRAKRAGRDRVVRDDESVDAVWETGVVPQTLDDADDMSGEGSAPRSGAGVRRALERMHLVGMAERQHRHNPVVYLVVLASFLPFAPTLGLLALAPALLGAAVFRATQRRVASMTRPERALGLAWLVAQASNVAMLALMNQQVLWALPALAIMVVANAAAFPGRYVVAGSLVAVAYAVGAALLIDPRVLVSAPEALSSALALIMCAAITGRAVGRLASNAHSDASHDRLTGLPNRAACVAAAQSLASQWVEHHRRFAVIVGDLDHFKHVNDSAGHIAGDGVLVDLVRRLNVNMRGDAMMFRLGGEEFGVLVADADGHRAMQIAERLRAAVADGPLAGHPVTISFGVATACDEDGGDYAKVFRRADRALYAAKAAGRNCVRLDEAPVAQPAMST